MIGPADLPSSWPCCACITALPTGDLGVNPRHEQEKFDVSVVLFRHGIRPATGECRSKEHLIIEVRDDSSASPRVSHAALLDEGGRGLLLAESLASGWGTYALEDGKVVWAAWGLGVEVP